MLRYYDEVGLLKPTKIDPITEYRLYSVDEIPKLQKIIFLRDLNFKVSEIKAAVDNWNDASISKYLLEKEGEIKKHIALENEKISKIHKAIEDIEDNTMAIHQNVVVKAIDPMLIVSLRKTIDHHYLESTLWQALFEFIMKENIKLPKPYRNIAIFHDEEYKEENVAVEVGIEVCGLEGNREGFVFREIKGLDQVAAMMIPGPFSNINKGYLNLAKWLLTHPQYEMIGPTRQLLHRGPGNEENPENYLTEIQIPIKKIK